MKWNSHMHKIWHFYAKHWPFAVWLEWNGLGYVIKFQLNFHRPTPPLTGDKLPLSSAQPRLEGGGHYTLTNSPTSYNVGIVFELRDFRIVKLMFAGILFTLHKIHTWNIPPKKVLKNVFLTILREKLAKKYESFFSFRS